MSEPQPIGDMLDEIARLRARIDGLRTLGDELAEDLSAEVNARYGDDVHPALQLKYTSDMMPVIAWYAATQPETPQVNDAIIQLGARAEQSYEETGVMALGHDVTAAALAESDAHEIRMGLFAVEMTAVLPILDAHTAVCAERDALIAALDHEMVNCLQSTFTLGDDPKKALNTLLDWAQGLGAYFEKQRHEKAPHE